MFGGHIINEINSAELPFSPRGLRLQFQHENEVADDM